MRFRTLTAVVASLMCAMAASAAGAQVDTVARARAAALAGQRGAAIVMLRESLAATPGDTDARVLLGTILSWEGRQPEARAALAIVLEANPLHLDALAAMINVELWSRHPERAVELSARALRERPDDPALLLAHAHGLLALKRPADARVALDRVLEIDPANGPARLLRRDIKAASRLWHVEAGVTHDAFGDQRTPWLETRIGIARKTSAGPIAFNMARAQRFGLRDQTFEVEAYPRIWKHTQGYVAAAYSPAARLYPEYRLAADVTQNLGAGFEVTAGYRRLGFGAPVNMYVASVSRYAGPWLFTGRAFVTPRSSGAAAVYQGSVRRYFGEVTRIGLGAVHGGPGEVRSVNDAEVIGSDAVTTEARFLLLRRLELGFTGSLGRETRAGRVDMRRYALGTALALRF